MRFPIGRKLSYLSQGPFFVNADAHTRIIGETGTGKSILMTDMAIHDMRAGRGMAFIDPTDEAVDRLLSYIPKNRTEDVIVVDPLCPKPIGLRVLGGKTREERIKRADQFIDTVSKYYGENSWGGNSAFIARNFLYALMEVVDNPSPLHLYEMLMSEEYRDEIFECATSENLKKFKKKFDKDWRDTQREQNAAAPTNKSDIPVANWIIRDMLCQRGETLDLFAAMQRNAIILCRFGKGRLGPEAGKLLGAFMLQEFLFAGMARSAVAPKDRQVYKVYVDEFHNFVDSNDAADYMLKELRKYKLVLVGGDQETAGMPKANFTTTIVGAVDPISAEELANQFARPSLAEFLTAVPNYHWYAQTKNEKGVKTDPTYVKGLEPLKRLGTEYPAWRIVQYSELHHGVDREKVEREINRFLAA